MAFPLQRGSFVGLSEVLGSPLWEEKDAVTLTALWNALPQTIAWPLRDDQQRRAAHHLEWHVHDDPHPLLTASIFDLPSWLLDSPTRRADLQTYLRSYNTSSYSYRKVGMGPDDDPEVFTVGDRDCLILNFHVDDGRSADREQHREFFYRQTLTGGNGRRYLVPKVGSNASPMHPLMTWWTVLFTLSMLARYQPAEWSQAINVDASRYAVPIEQLLKAALVTVPRLVVSTLEEVA